MTGGGSATVSTKGDRSLQPGGGMGISTTQVVLAALVAPLMAGCVKASTYRRDLVQTRADIVQERQDRMAADSAQNGDITAVKTDVQGVKTDVEGLRSDLQNLRTEFGAKI